MHANASASSFAETVILMSVLVRFADVLLKVSALPYLLLLDLFQEVDSAATTATVSETHITFTLQKVSTLDCARLMGGAHAGCLAFVCCCELCHLTLQIRLPAEGACSMGQANGSTQQCRPCAPPRGIDGGSLRPPKAGGRCKSRVAPQSCKV